MTSREYNAIVRRQRQAYFTWQASPEPYTGPELVEYIAASKALAEAQNQTSLIRPGK